MQSNYDADSDTLTILWSDAPIQESDSDKPGVILDYDAEGNVIGVEILNASQRIKDLQVLAQAQ